MSTYLKWLIPLAIAAAAGAWYYLQDKPVIEAVEQTVISRPPAQAPAPTYPLVEQGDAPSPGAVDNSDESLLASLQMLFGSVDLSSVLIPNEIIRRLVITVDNLPREKLAVPLRPLRATAGQFVVTGTEDNLILSEDNFSRYSAVMALVKMADVEQCANWYREHYDLFQQAYLGLGYPDGYFNDRLVQTIDDLLGTPELTGPIQLVQPKVFYEFADPDLESRSAGQKTLLRMGPDNIRTLKQKLIRFRAEITKPAA